MPGPVAKSSTAFRTISEVAAEVGVEQHVLRFWETRFPQIEPIKRGGNRRYYRPADVELLKHISRLLYQEGYTIKGVQQLLARDAVADATALPVAAEMRARLSRPVVATPPRPAGEAIAQGEPAAMPALAAIRAQLAAALAAARAL